MSSVYCQEAGQMPLSRLVASLLRLSSVLGVSGVVNGVMSERK